MADIKNFGIVGVGSDVQFGKGGGTFKWDTDGFISTSNGTTLADLDAATMNFTGLSGTGAVTVTNILDEDNMASDSATALATQQSIKAYVDSQVAGGNLTGTGDSGAFGVNLATDTFGVLGGTNITTTGSGSNVTVALDSNISVDSVSVTNFVDTQFLTLGSININATGTEINYLDGSTPGTGTANNAVVLDANKDITGINDFTATTVNFDNLSGTGAVSVTDIIDDDTMGTASATTLATSESIKAYVDASATAADLDFQGDSGTGAVDLDSQALDIAGGTNLTTTASGQTLTVNMNADIAVDSVTATGNVDAGNVNLTGDISAVNGEFSGSVTFGSGTGGSLSGLASIEAGNVSATGNLIVGGYAITDILDEDNMVSDSDTAVPTQQSVKAYVDSVATSADLDFQGDSGSGAVDLDTQALDIAGGLNLTSTASGQTLTVAMDTTLTGMTAATFSGTVDAGTVEFDNLSGTGAVSVTDIIDDDTMGTASATTLATSESIKAYVDATATSADLDIAGDSGTGSVDLDSQVFTIAGGIGLSSTTTGQTTEVRLNNTAVTAGTYGDATNIPQFTVDQQGRITAASNVAIQTAWTLAGDSGSETVNGGDTATFAGGTNITTVASATDTLTVNLDSDISLTSVTATGNVDAGNVNATGDISAVNGEFSGSVTFGSGTGGDISGLETLTAESVVATSNIILNGYEVTNILDEDNMVSDSDTALATQQSIKAYVDSSITSSGVAINIQGDTGSGSIVFATDTLDIAGTANEIETSFDAGTDTMTIGLPDDVTIGNVTVSGTLNSDDITANTIEIDGDMTVVGDTVMQGNLTVNGNTTIINSNTIASGDAIIVLNSDLPSNQAPSQDMGLEMNRGSSANVHMLWKEGTDYFEFGDENSALQEVRAGTFNGTTLTDGTATLTGGDLSTTGDVTFGTLTDGGESITVTKFVDEADGLAGNDDDTSIPTSAAVIDYVDTNAGDGNLIRNGSVGTGATTVTIGTVPSNANRIYYLLKVVVKVTVAFSGNSVDHIIVNEDGGLGTQIVTDADADALNTGTYVIEGDGATTLENGETILLGFRDSGNNLVAPTAGAMSVSVFYGWEDAPA
jgi:hypothetical protein